MQQGELNVLGDINRPLKLLPLNLVTQCEDEVHAKKFMLENGPIKKDYLIADQLNQNAGNFSKMKKGIAGYPPNSDLKLMRMAGNIGYLQYLAYHVGVKLVPMTKEEIEINARAEIEALKEQNEMLQQQLAGNW